MENVYTQTNYSLTDQILTFSKWEFVFYIVAAIVIGYLIHYTFSRRRDYVRTPKKRPSFYYDDTLTSAYYPHSEPIYPQQIIHHDVSLREPSMIEFPILTKNHSSLIQEHNYELYSDQNIQKVSQQNFVPSEFQNQPSQQDDLKIIEGIGPKIEEILNKAKIKTWHQLSQTSVEELRSILHAAGPRYQMHDPSSWPEQAHLAETKQWAMLESFQDQLDGGKYTQAMAHS